MKYDNNLSVPEAICIHDPSLINGFLTAIDQLSPSCNIRAKAAANAAEILSIDVK